MTSRRAQRPQGPPDPKPFTTSDEPEPSLPQAPSPEIGHGCRWYDVPFVLLRTLLRMRLARWLPTRVRVKLREASRYMYQVHVTHQRRLDGDPGRHGRIELPPSEQVWEPNVWIVEYFTASTVRHLYAAIRKNGWDGASLDARSTGTRSLLSSRSGLGQTWWRITSLVSHSAKLAIFDSHRAKLPDGVDRIELLGVSIGNGLTAVVAGFSLSESASDRLNGAIRKEYRPTVIRRKGRLARAESPKFVLYHEVQKKRTELHEVLRGWMSTVLPGSFAGAKEPHPLFDLLFFEVAEHWSAEDAVSQHNDAPRATGVEVNAPEDISSSHLPGLQVQLPGGSQWAPGISPNVWTLWGNRSAVARLTTGTDTMDFGSAGYFVGEAMTDFFVRSGLTSLLSQLRRSASAAHDNARHLHGGTSSRDLKRLRNRTLTTSLDLARLRDDLKIYNTQLWRDREPQFFVNLSPADKALDAAAGRPVSQPIDLNKRERQHQMHLAKELVSFDAEYRQVLSTVTSLGASLDSRRVQRVATWVSVASLGTALVALWLSQDTPPDIGQVVGDAWVTWNSLPYSPKP